MAPFRRALLPLRASSNNYHSYEEDPDAWRDGPSRSTRTISHRQISRSQLWPRAALQSRQMGFSRGWPDRKAAAFQLSAVPRAAADQAGLGFSLRDDVVAPRQ